MYMTAVVNYSKVKPCAEMGHLDGLPRLCRRVKNKGNRNQ